MEVLTRYISYYYSIFTCTFYILIYLLSIYTT